MREHCDCADPTCGLPSGRCAVCGNPCEADHYGTEVCAQCVPRIRALYEAARASEPDPDGPPWFYVDHEEHDGSAYIVRNDSRALFEDDEAAAAHVVALIAPPTTEETPPMHDPEAMHPETAERIRAALAAAFPGIAPTVALARLLDEHAEARARQVSRRLTVSDLARLRAVLLGAAQRDREGAEEEGVPSVAAQLEHQADHAAALADEIDAASAVLIVP